MDSIRKHLTFANGMAMAAVFIALGAGAYAASTAPKDSVTSKSIQEGAVQSKDVQDDGLTGTDVDEKTLVCAKIATCGSAGPAGPRGATGPAGVVGQTGATGESGTPGAPGAAGSARAYGLVASGGPITRSKGLATATANGGTGIYCIQLDASIDAATAVVVASVDRSSDSTVLSNPGTNAFVEPLATKSGADCTLGNPNEIEIRTYQRNEVNNVTATNEPFFFMVP
jgi:hypothetical protein